MASIQTKISSTIRSNIGDKVDSAINKVSGLGSLNKKRGLYKPQPESITGQQYPEDLLSNPEYGEFIVFKNTRSKPQEIFGDDIIKPEIDKTKKEQKSPSRFDPTKKKGDHSYIYLYVPVNSMLNGVSLGWDSLETGGPLAGLVADTLEGKLSLASAGEAAASAGVKSLGSSGIGAMVKRAQKIQYDPKIRSQFTGVNLRTFVFRFDFVPRSYEELKESMEIIDRFRYNSLPDISSGGQYIYPDEWSIDVMSKGKNDSAVSLGILTSKKCWLTSVSADYTAGQVWSTFESGHPVKFGVSLQFTEDETLNRDSLWNGVV